MARLRAHAAQDVVRSHAPAAGRYSRRALRTAILPANGVGERPRSRQVSLARVAIDDPFDAGAKLQATANRRVDVLEQERAHARISEAAYLTGRVVQAVFERMAGGIGGAWREGSRVDAAVAHELAILGKIKTARELQAMMARIEKRIGVVGARFLRQVIGDGVPLATYAERRGKSGVRAVAQVSAHFRMLLEDLAESWDEGRARIEGKRPGPDAGGGAGA